MKGFQCILSSKKVLKEISYYSIMIIIKDIVRLSDTSVVHTSHICAVNERTIIKYSL